MLLQNVLLNRVLCNTHGEIIEARKRIDPYLSPIDFYKSFQSSCLYNSALTTL